MKDFRNFLNESANGDKPVVFAFGRMNPPTAGHAKLVDKVHELAKKHDAHHEIVLSHSHESKKNPLSPETKLKHAKRFFPNTNLSTSSKEHPSFIAHAKRLSDAGHKHLIMVAGSDRVKDYKDTLHKYNGKEYNFKKIDVVSAGHRDPDSEGVEGMSASKMRDHAKTNNYKEFRKGVPSHVSHEHAKELYNDVRSGLAAKKTTKLSEDLDKPTPTPKEVAKKHGVDLKYIMKQLEAGIKIEKEHTDDEDTAREIALDHLSEKPDYYKKLKMYVESEIKIGSLIESESGELGKILSLREDCVVYNPLESGRMQTAEFGTFRLLEAIGNIGTAAPPYFFGGVADYRNQKEQSDGHTSRSRQDSDLKQSKTTTPAKYYAGLEKGTKQKRLSHFRKQGEKSWKDPSAYEPAPGDKEAKTRPSKHTLKYKKMFGEGTYLGTGTGEFHGVSDSPQINRKGTQNYHLDKEMNEEAEKGLAAKAKESGVSLSILKKVYNRGMAAWRGGHRPGTTPQQWGMARVNSYITKGKGTYYGADADLRKEDMAYGGQVTSNLPYYSGQRYERDNYQNVREEDAVTESHLFGTDSARKAYQEMTPGEPGYGGANSKPSVGYDTRDGETNANITRKLKKKFKAEDFMGADYNSRLSGSARSAGGLGGSWSIPVQEEKLPRDKDIMEWAKSQSTQKMFAERYGEYAGDRLVEAAQKMAKEKTKKMKSFSKFRNEDMGMTIGSGSDGREGPPVTGYAKQRISEEMQYHLDNNISISENVYRVGSKNYFQIFREARELNEIGVIELDEETRHLVEETDIGEFAVFEDQNVPLDCPMISEEEDDEKDPPIGKPRRGGPKKFYVYVRKPDGGVKKVTWGDTTGLSVKLNDPEARKSFAARHQCDQQTDKTSAAYWACNTPRYAKQLGLSGGGSFFW